MIPSAHHFEGDADPLMDGHRRMIELFGHLNKSVLR
jgi:hypothetical protein